MTDESELNEVQAKLKYPIWKFQWLFQPQVAGKAREVFSRLDGRLNPKLSLLGIPLVHKDESSGICLQLADDCGYNPEVFSGVMKLAKKIDEEIASQSPFRKPVPEKISDPAIQFSVGGTLSKLPEKSGTISYCSLPTALGTTKFAASSSLPPWLTTRIIL